MNLGTLLKSEIARLARKQLKTEIEPLRRAVTAHRTTLAKLRREIAAVEQQLKALQKGAAEASATHPDEESSARRFSAKGLVSHRQKLGFSREQYAQLVGVSGQSIYKWERGESRPRRAQLEALTKVRTLGKNAALARIEAAQ